MVDKKRFSSDNLYTVLGVGFDADHSEIKKMYQELVLKFHPDKFNPEITKCTSEEARDYFCHIDKAWKILSDSKSKAEYDVWLRDMQLTQEWPVDAEVDLSEMIYEEDFSQYTWPCRCSGSYTITEENLEREENIISCSTCTLTIKVLFCIEEDNG